MPQIVLTIACVGATAMLIYMGKENRQFYIVGALLGVLSVFLVAQAFTGDLLKGAAFVWGMRTYLFLSFLYLIYVLYLDKKKQGKNPPPEPLELVEEGEEEEASESAIDGDGGEA
ncbi:MAG: hypothetical protein LBS74_05535 [Oscillospiraceae bacterium]|jgi:hypothetical protein|nr:hypothetical protein [Oscillospiraceae bacterium]